MYGSSILRSFNYPNTLSPQLVRIIEVPLYYNDVIVRMGSCDGPPCCIDLYAVDQWIKPF